MLRIKFEINVIINLIIEKSIYHIKYYIYMKQQFRILIIIYRLI